MPLIFVLLFNVVSPETFNDDNAVTLSVNKDVPPTCNNALVIAVPTPNEPATFKFFFFFIIETSPDEVITNLLSKAPVGVFLV